MKKFLPLLAGLFVTFAHADEINVVAQTADVDCRDGHRCSMSSHHEIQIINVDVHPHIYNYYYELCSVNGDTQPDCVHVGNAITIQGGQTWNNSFGGYMEPVLYKGRRVIRATTHVEGYQKAEKIDFKVAYVK